MREVLKMNDKTAIPILGLGTWLVENDKAERVVSQALKLGYRHIDTAQAYKNEVGVGKGIFLSGIPREEIFVTSKVAAEHKNYQDASQSIDLSLRDLGLDYLDLMIIHSPQPWSEWRSSDKNFDQGNLEAWRALEDAQKAGKVKSIGLSNFLIKDVENILKNSNKKPAVNQILSHIGNTPFALIDYCKEHNIVVEAYSPIAHGQALKNDILKKVASKYNVSSVQLSIQYILQLGMVALPKAENPEHMLSNMTLDFTISREDMALLKSVKFVDYGEYANFPVFSGK
ncbi:aldo/keto reductase [Streptococcus didelphis]|uniref:Aldo/keto reductase n=1 Tax=Streptococcus didelphis TaxID=102886 RepID=A0ABY9LH48_9STRE|nr:aldo/keto reductase [Streptococcus didelphis]WMB28177.1 aldo/keto reductase [Streptococcus didelphis]